MQIEEKLLPHHQLKKNNVKKSNIYGVIGTVVSCTVLFLILWFVILPVVMPTTPVEEEGIMVSFGDNDNGSGMNENPAEPYAPVNAPVNKPAVAASANKSTKTAQEEILTQTTDNSNYIAEQKKKDKDRKDKLTLENQRIEATNRAASEATADRKRKEQVAINNANGLNGMFGNNNSTGSGTGSGDTHQGNPAGKGSSGGNSWSLNGRSLTGRLVSPSYNRHVEGKITVNIRVDENGNVVSATIGSPATISDAETRNAARTAALNTHFTAGKGVSAGSITYNFNLK